MRTHYAVAYTCDSCGTQASTPEQTGPPDTWFNSGARPGLEWFIGDPFGQRFMDLCPACTSLPFVQILTNILKRNSGVA